LDIFPLMAYAVRFDTGCGRHAAHRLYPDEGFELNCRHMAAELRRRP